MLQILNLNLKEKKNKLVIYHKPIEIYHESIEVAPIEVAQISRNKIQLLLHIKFKI